MSDPTAPVPSRRAGLLAPRLRRVDVAVAVLLALLGFAAVVQVRSTQEDGPLAAARQEDLVQILDDLANRNERLRAEVSALEELRAAGAEAVQVEGEGEDGEDVAVRVVASTAFVAGEQGGIAVDGELLRPPYRFVLIGDPATLVSAVRIPGGVVDNVEQLGGRVVVQRGDAVQVTALRRLEPPRYARPTP